jgi:hypothetical protein
LLYAGDFDGSGRSHLLEAQYEGDTLYPIRGLAQLRAVLPSLGKRFPTFEAYANSPLAAVVPSDRLASAQRLAATELRSGVFLSQPGGTYRFEPLPRLAQIAPIFGIAVGDFDGDGNSDIYVVQNSYAPIPETGRFDGGLSLLLRGDGHGHLTPVPPAESGLLVPHDAKALLVADGNQDGWPDFIVTRNNDRMLTFRNQPMAGRHSFGIALRGGPANPTGVGATISVVLSDGRTETAEVSAGSGYLSQSSPSQFFGYLDENPPRELHVRWPDGRTSATAWTNPGKKPLIVIRSP